MECGNLTTGFAQATDTGLKALIAIAIVVAQGLATTVVEAHDNAGLGHA